jgi:replicative DNA helicase
MGKTQHALAIAKSASLSDVHTLFVSIEMTTPQLINRLLLEDDRISEYNIRNGELDQQEWEAIYERTAKIDSAKLHIADHHNIRYLTNIKSEARRLKRKGKLGLLIIDYLGLIKTNMKFGTRQLEIAHITGELKALAKELEIPVILLSQLSRPIKGTAVKEPQLEDLRESGDIEQDADIVLFIHKPDYYKPEAVDSGGVAWLNRGKLIIAKYREGARNNVILFSHDNRYKKIFDYQAPAPPPPNFKPLANFYEPTKEVDDIPF